MKSLVKIAAEITLSQTTEVLSLDGSDFSDCEGWYIPKHGLMVTYKLGNSDVFFSHCVQRAGSVSSLGQSVSFERAMHELHNDFGGDTWAVGQADLIRRGWVRFSISEGRVSIYIGDRKALTMLSILLLPYASEGMVLNDWKREYEVKEPSEAQVQSILDQLGGSNEKAGSSTRTGEAR